MTVNTTSITSGPYPGNDVADTFNYTFKIEDKSQLSVYETDDLGVETLLTVDTNYTVAGIGDAGGGTVTRVAGALPTNYEWFIRSDYKYTQLTAFQSQGAFFPDLHEDMADKLTFLTQQILDKLSRAPVVSDTYTGTLPLSLPDPVASNFLRWNSALDGFDNVDIAGQGLLVVSEFAKTYLDELTAAATRSVLETKESFTDLDQTPSSLTSQAEKVPKVNAGETALEFVDYINTLLQLTDAPSSYSGEAGKTVKVNSGETAVEFVDDSETRAAALVNFDGTGSVTINKQINVASITDNGTGNYTANFSTAMPNADFIALLSAGPNNNAYMGRWIQSQTTGGVQVLAARDGSGNAIDVSIVNVAVFSVA